MLKILLALLAFIGGSRAVQTDNADKGNVFENLAQEYIPLKKAVIDSEPSDVGYYSFYVDISGKKGILKFWTGD